MASLGAGEVTRRTANEAQFELTPTDLPAGSSTSKRMKTHPLFEGNSLAASRGRLTHLDRVTSMTFVTNHFQFLRRFAMKSRFLETFVAAAALMVAGASHAVIVDFEGDIDTSKAGFAPFLVHNDEIVNKGFYIDAISNAAAANPGDLVGSILNGTDLASTCAGLTCPSNNSTTFLAGLNDGLFAIGAVGDALFRFAGFDASFIGAQGVALPAVPGLVRLQGVRADNTSITQTFNLGGPSSTGALSFRSYATTGAFSTTLFQYVYLFGFSCNTAGACAAFSNDQAQFAIDNINVNAIPEPSTWALMLGGLAAAAAVRRRSVKATS
jgi:hypothetical protein